MPVPVGSEVDGGVTQPLLHYLDWQFEPAVEAAIDAPRGIEMSKRMQALVLGPYKRLPVPIAFGLAVTIQNGRRYPCG